MTEHSTSHGKRWPVKCWLGSLLLFFIGLGTGIVIVWQLPYLPPRKIEFAQQQIPTLMMHPLGREGASRHQIGNWELLSSLTTGNDSLTLKYKDTYIAAISAASDHSIESMVINHPLHDSVLLILGELNQKDTVGKLTTDILTNDGSKSGFVLDENLDGQPDLRFEYAGPHLYVWLDESWHRVLRSSPRESGAGFKHTVIYRQQMHEINMEKFPYKLTPLIARIGDE